MTVDIFSAYLARLSGFSFSRLDELRFEESTGAARAADQAEIEERAAAERLLDVLDRERSAEDHPSRSNAELYAQLKNQIRRARNFARSPTGELPEEAFAATARVLPRTASHLEALAVAHRRAFDALQNLGRVFEAELGVKRRALREVYARDPRLLEAVLLESRSAFDRLEAWSAHPDETRGARARERERLAMLYFQRFCAKNETNSMCGPHSIGFVEATADGNRFRIVDELFRRTVYFSFWGAERLLETFAGQAGRSRVLRLRRNPTARIDEAGGESFLSWCAMSHDATKYFRRKYRRTTATQEIRAVFEALEDPKTAESIIAALADTGVVDEEEAAEIVDQLIEAGLILDSPALPVGLIDPLAAVADEIARWPEWSERSAARSLCDELSDLTHRFESAPLAARKAIAATLDKRFEEATSTSSVRGQGEHYADRSLLSEDCYSKLEIALSAAQIEALKERLGDLVSATALPVELARENVRHWFKARFSGRSSVSALEAHRAFDEERPYERAADSPIARDLSARIARVQQLIRTASSNAADHVAVIDSSAFRDAVDGAPGADRPGYASADILFARREHRPPMIVIGEIHAMCLMPTHRLQAAPEEVRGRTLERLRSTLRHVVRGRATAEPLFLHTQATDRRFPVTTTELEMIGASDRNERIRLGDLEMTLDGGRFRFSAKRGEVVPISMYRPYPFFAYTSDLCPLIDDFVDRFFPKTLLPQERIEMDCPRLTLGDVAFRRRVWVRSAPDIRDALSADDDARILLKASALRRSLGAGRFVFASVPGEPKPILVDFENFFLLEAFARMLKRCPNDAKVQLGEMLPNADELVLQGPDGLRTFELRMGLLR